MKQMSNEETYENFPFLLVAFSALFSVSIYLIGAILLSGFGILIVIFYLFYCAWMEFRLLKQSCKDCYYYGKVCCLGRSKLVPLFFKKGDQKRFADKQIAVKDLIPDFLVSIIPIIGGIILLFLDFKFLTLFLTFSLVSLSFGGNVLIRSSFACKYCKQKEIGCPAEKLFNK